MKFFKWQIDTKIKRLDADERILFLADRLIKEIEDSGRKVSFESGTTFIPVTFTVTVHNNYKPARLFVQNIHNGWEVCGDYEV